MVAFFGLDEKAHPKNALHSSDVRLLINEQTIPNAFHSLLLNASIRRAHETHPLWLFFYSLFAQIAQLVEQGTENPCVTGSIPVLGTSFRFDLELFLCKSLSVGQRSFGAYI